MALDTGTDRPGLDKSTYKVRRAECDAFAAELVKSGHLSEPKLAGIRTPKQLAGVQKAHDAARTPRQD